MLEKNLKLTEVMITAYNSFKNPQDIELSSQVKDYIGKMMILPYLPLREKQISVFRILNLIEETERRPDEVSSTMELLFTLEVINQYTNIEVENECYELFGEDFLDALEIVGIMDAIQNVSGRDINRLQHMVDSTINWRNIFNLVDGFGSIDMSHVDQLVNEVREARQGLKEENIDILKRIADYNQPNVHNFSDMISASIINSLDKVSEDQLAKWHEDHNLIVDLDNILGEKSYENISKEISDYFESHPELGKIEENEIKNVYEYLKNKNQEKIDKINYQIDEENKSNIAKGISSQMIKLLSKKKALEKKYKKEEELLRLADTVMSMDVSEIDDIAEVLEKIKNEKENNK